MIYITGDMHGNAQQAKKVFNKINCKPENTLIILGDFGGNYYLNKKDDNFKKIINDYGVQVFVIRGNHDANPIKVKGIAYTEKYGDKGYIEPKFPNIFYAKNGSEYVIEGNKFLVLGGAYSVDKWYRLNNKFIWFSDEQMTEEEKVEFWSKGILQTQTILSHTCPYPNVPKYLFLNSIDQSTVDNSMEMFLSEVKCKIKYNNWFFGHYHANEEIEQNMYMLYDGIIHYKPQGKLKIY